MRPCLLIIIIIIIITIIINHSVRWVRRTSGLTEEYEQHHSMDGLGSWAETGGGDRDRKRERETERQTEKERGGDRETEGENAEFPSSSALVSMM